MFFTKSTKKKIANRIFSIAGLSAGAVVLLCLIVHVARTMDIRVLLRSVRPTWLVAAALCVPISQAIDGVLIYGIGRSAGCRVRMLGCLDAAFIGEFYYKLGPAGAPVQVKLMYDAGMPATKTAAVYIWKMISNFGMYVVYVAVALVYVLAIRKMRLGMAMVGLIILMALYLTLFALAMMMANRPGPLMRLIRRILVALSKKVKYLAREGMVDAGMRKVEELSGQLRAFEGNRKLFVGLFVGMALELAALFLIPYCLYRGLNLQEESLIAMLLLQAMVMIITRIVMLPGNVGGAEGSFYLFMAPVFGENFAVALVLWRIFSFLEVMLIGGVWSVVRFARRSLQQGREP